MEQIHIKYYNRLVKVLIKKLTSNDIAKKYADIYLNYLDMITEGINSNSTQSEYEDAIVKLLQVFEELQELDHSNIDNYKCIEINKPETDRNDDAHIQAFVDEITHNLDDVLARPEIKSTVYSQAIRERALQILDNIKKIKANNSERRIKIIASLLMLSVLIGAPIHLFLGIRKKTDYRVVYPTREIIYDTKKQQEDLEFYHGMPVVGNILSYNDENLEFNDVADNAYVYKEDGYHYCYYVLKEMTPWEKIGREAVRHVRSCTIGANEIGTAINIGEFDNLYYTYGGTETKEVILVSEVPRIDRKFYSEEENAGVNTYEVILYDQNITEPINVAVAKDYTDLYLLLAFELFLWVTVVEITNGLLIEGVIENLMAISQNKKLLASQRENARKLHDEYVKIYNSVKKKLKKKHKNK